MFSSVSIYSAFVTRHYTSNEIFPALLFSPTCSVLRGFLGYKNCQSKIKLALFYSGVTDMQDDTVCFFIILIWKVIFAITVFTQLLADPILANRKSKSGGRLITVSVPVQLCQMHTVVMSQLLMATFTRAKKAVQIRRINWRIWRTHHLMPPLLRRLKWAVQYHSAHLSRGRYLLTA